MKRLYGELPIEEVATITEKLEKAGYKYKLENDGKVVTVDEKKVYEIRMALAREGLPTTRSIGYEIFDKTNIGATDFVQKLNARRALEGELQRTIEGLEEIKSARVHIVVPEPTIFLEKQQKPKASVVLKTELGRTLSKEQVKGISHLISSSIEGLEPVNISIVDDNGRLLSNSFGDDETALASSRNLELQQNVEQAMERKLSNLLNDILGPEKARVQAAVDLDFDQIERTIEKYDPESRVVRSEERTDQNVKNAPDGDQQQERALTNYEIDKSIEHIIHEVGNIKRLTISVAVDGKYAASKKGERAYSLRSPEEMASLEEIVKNAVGYELTRGDQIVVAQMQFDNEFIQLQQQDIQKEQQWRFWMSIAKYAVFLIIAVMVIILIRQLAKTLAEAMNPPLPQVEINTQEEIVPIIDIPENIQRSNEILERVEMMTQQEPLNITTVIREWLKEPLAKKAGGKKTTTKKGK